MSNSDQNFELNGSVANSWFVCFGTLCEGTKFFPNPHLETPMQKYAQGNPREPVLMQHLYKGSAIRMA